MHVNLGGYHIRDIELTAAFDVNHTKVGKDLAEAVFAELFKERGVRLDRTYQLNFGGNTDFLNMLERERLESKKIPKLVL